MRSKKDKKRVLTAAEQKRAAHFESISADMISHGYTRNDLVISIVKANIFAILLLLPLAIIGFWLFYLVNEGARFHSFSPVIFLIVFVALIVVHELIHGICWSIFTPNHFKDVEFGVMRSSMTPYCTCLVPLGKWQYLFGAIMPFVILGILPMIAGILAGNPMVLFLGILMADAAAGDIMVVHKILRYKSKSSDIVYMDHPTEAGGVIFER